MARRIEDAKVSVGCPPPSLSGSGEKWRSFQFHFHDFSNLSTTRKQEFICNGHRWQLKVYPGGDLHEGQVSAFVCHLSEGRITTGFGIKVIDEFGKTTKRTPSSKNEFYDGYNHCGYDIISRSVLLDESENILDDNGTLTLIVSIEEESTTVFVPKNPLVKMMREMFNDGTTADVCFEVSTAEGKDDDDDRTKRAKTTTPFYAHRSILEKCAPILAAICGSNNDSGGVAVASVNDVKPHIFHHLLFYVYGGSIPEEELKTHAKGIIDAADKYSIINLKLAAEAAYVQSTDISLDNAMDNLLYADSRNCALLKEAVMNFLADNHYAAASNISFADFPGHVVKDLLVAFGRNSKKGVHGTNVDELTTLCVSALRRKLDKMGLEVDGSREAMIDSIKSHS
ncbi:hypothetical protein ACHAWT_005041 [Skeletonema menzelii]